MKALVCRELSGDLSTLQLEDVELPPLGPDEVRLRVRAASVNFPDLLMVQGKYQHKPELPFIVGGECAGDVIAVGTSVRGTKIGDAVIGAGLTGGFSEECQLPATAVRPLPAGADFATAASFTTAYLTAYVALVRRAELQLGETLLVHGAAGGVGGDVFDESTRCIAFGGRLLVIGFTSGRIPSVAANIPLIKGFSVVGVRAGEYGRRFPEKGRENIAAIDRLLVETKLRPHIGARFPLAHAVDAMRSLSARRIIGKAVIEV